MNREKLILLLVKQETNDIVGAYENSLMDGHIEKMPSREEMAEKIYQQIITSTVVETNGSRVSVEKDIRFAGKDKIKNLIEKKLSKVLG